jgi:hypothetical protein
MNTDLDHAIMSVVADIVAAAPEVTADPTVITITPTAASTSRRHLLAAAAMIVVAAGVTGIALANHGGTSQQAPGVAGQPASPAVTIPPPEPTAPVIVPAVSSIPSSTNTKRCAAGDQTGIVPMVAGLSYDEATATLQAAGFVAEARFENSPAGTANGDDPVISQLADGNPVPTEPARCGASIPLTVALLPGRLHLVQDGETYPTIAQAEGISVDELLSYNGLTQDEVTASGRSIDSPLMGGQAISVEWSITAVEGPVCTGTPGGLTASQRAALRFVLAGGPQNEVIDEISTRWCGGQLTQEQAQAIVEAAAIG